MSSDYQEPPWAASPTGSWSITEIKGGVQIAQHVLNKPCVLLGRAADQVDITLQHESSSREHARIAFDGAGTPWFRDLESTHGSTVNRKRLPTAAIGRCDSMSTKKGSRGVVLYPGDILKFGASTRIFCLEGPIEFERGAASARAAIAKAKANAALPVEQPVEKQEGMDRGKREMEDAETEELTLKLPHDVEDKIDDKHRKEHERLRALTYKLENIQAESERIRRKGELSEGQEKQLQRNDEREQKLREETDQKEAELHRKVFPGKHAPAHARQEKTTYGEENDYDFYDRTKSSASGEDINDGETEQSLTFKWKDDRELLTGCRVDLEHAKHRVLQTEKRLAATQADGDEEAAFFIQNDLNLSKEAVDKMKHKRRQLHKEMEESKRLLNIVNPKLTVDEATGFVGEGTVPSNGAPGMLPPPSCAEMMSASGESDAFVMPPATAVEPTSNASGASSMRPPPQRDFFMPPPKRTRVVGPTIPAPTMPVPLFETLNDYKQKVKRPTGPPKGTLSVLSAAGVGSVAVGSRRSASPSSTGSGKGDILKQAPTYSDPQKDVWQAPKDQDGSGITKLNAKFGGRY